MGQTLGRAPLPAGCKRFLNLPRSCVYDLWEAFNDIAEGFGLTIEEFQEIVKSALMEYLAVTEKVLNVDTDTVFRTFDDDENNLVDSLEFLSSFALLSGMTPEEKIRFIFAMYDFDETSMLTVDEMVLAFRSTLAGLSKLSKVDPPSEAEIESIVVQAFDTMKQVVAASSTSASSAHAAASASDIDAIDFPGIDKETFVKFCLNTPEVMSWIEYFDDLEEYELELQSRKPIPIPKPTHLDRTRAEEGVMHPALGGQFRLEYERKGFAKEFVPRQKWQNVMPMLAPARMPDQPRDMPSQLVKLEWVYGFNAHSSRQCLYYNAKGHIIYAAGSVCIVQDIQQHSQKHFIEHTDLVTCLKVVTSPTGGTIVATGETGIRPAVHIWDAENLVLLSSLQGFHRNGVLQVDFSPDRSKLATLGADIYHSIAVYIWQTRQRVWAARSTVEPVFDVRFLSNDQIASCGKDHVYFWKENKKNSYQRFRGLFGSAVKPEILYCVNKVGNNVITGSESGMIHVWEGRNLVSSVKGHTGGILSCHVVFDPAQGAGLITACSNGKLQLWNDKLEVGATFNALALGAIDSAIVSVCWDMLACRILLGFKSCEIFEMDATEGRNAHDSAVVSGHFHPRVCGLAPHPLSPKLFCTVGDDKSVRVYDAEHRKLLRVSMLDTKGHCCSYSPDGQLIAIGLGSGIEFKEERKEGAFVVLNEQDLTLVHEARDSKNLIADCKYSPDGSLLALASTDGSIYVYNADDYAARARCRGHTGQVEHIDFSHNGKFIMSNGSGGELLFWDAEKGELQPPKTLKEMLWDTNSCVYSYATQSIWGPYDDGVYNHASCRSNSRELVAAADNYGRVRVYIAPVVKEDPTYLQLNAHAAYAANCRFSNDDSRLFTTGGRDGTVCQWRLAFPDVQDYEELKQDDTINLAVPTELKWDRKAWDRLQNYEDVINERPRAVCDMEEGLVDVTQLLPWQRAIVAPSRVPTEDNSDPPDSLSLEFVYGFTSDRSRKAIMYTKAGELAFFSAGVAVIMNQKARTQQFYVEHSATITAMAVHPSQNLIASGEMGEIPNIRVWSSMTRDTKVILKGFHRRAITHLVFSNDGKYLASMGHDQYHSIAVYDWKNEVIIAHTRGISVHSFSLEFNPVGDGLVQCGNEIIRFWEICNRNMVYQDALLGSRAKRQGFLCSGWIGSNAVVGCADGNLYRFVGRQLDTIVQAHSDSINAICSSNYGICTASSDRFVKMWTHSLECRLVIDIKSLGSLNPNVRTICWDPDLFRILVGTANSEIYELSSGDGENIHTGPLLEGHGGEELWGLAVNPTKDEFCTVGDDAKLRIWDLLTHRSINSVSLELPARCCAYSPDGRTIAIGYGCPQRVTGRQYDGKWVVLSTEDYQVIHEARDSVKWLTEIKYSPNGQLIAIGSFDNKVYVYNINEGYSLSAVISRHQAFIRSFDFAEGSDWLQTNCAGFELMFFEADTGLYIPAPSRLRDTVWATQNCAMGWAVQGVWSPQRDGTEVTACECNLFRVGDGPIVATGDNYGRIQLFRYPCQSTAANSKKYKAGSNAITRMRFAGGDSMLITLSGVDKSIMQWSHKRDRSDEIAWNVTARRHPIEEDEEDVLKFFGLAAADEVASTNEIKDVASMMVSGRPWVASIVAPTEPKLSTGQTPEFRLEKSHVFGSQVDLARNSTRFNREGDIVFPATRYVCVYNKKKNQQLFYEGHQNEVTCVATTRDGCFVASSERGNRPYIHIWDAITCELIVTLPYFHRRGIAAMHFSSSRKYLVTIGKDADHSLAVWESPSGDWYDGAVLSTQKSDVNPSLFCAFYDDCPYNQFQFVSGGRFHQKFWEIKGKNINAFYPEYDTKQKLSTLLCGASVKHIFVSGSTNGHLFVWEGRKMLKMIRAHDLAITCLYTSDCAVVSASKDGTIKQWTSEMEHVRTFALREADVPPLLSAIRSIDGGLSLEGDTLTRILASTAGGEIYEIAARSGGICLVSEAHHSGELWGLCVHPTDPDLFATVGDDKTIRVWSVSYKRVLRKAALDCTARCIGWSPDGKSLVVGMGGQADGKRQRKDGAFLVLDAINLKPLFEGRDSRHWLQDCKFSPDGNSFAVGSMDHKIYIYNRESYRLKGACDRHNSYVRGFDFSEDSVYVQSDSGDFEHLYFEAEDGEFFSAGSQLKDIQWSDWTCCFGWPVQGAWPPYEEVENGEAFEPSSMHRSPDEVLLSVGDKNGNVKVYNYPCISKTANSVSMKGHVNEISKVRFTCNGRYLISLGKVDRNVIVWKVLPDKQAAKARAGGGGIVGEMDLDSSVSPSKGKIKAGAKAGGGSKYPTKQTKK